MGDGVRRHRKGELGDSRQHSGPYTRAHDSFVSLRALTRHSRPHRRLLPAPSPRRTCGNQVVSVERAARFEASSTRSGDASDLGPQDAGPVATDSDEGQLILGSKAATVMHRLSKKFRPPSRSDPNDPHPTVLVIGATGQVGASTVRELLARDVNASGGRSDHPIE